MDEMTSTEFRKCYVKLTRPTRVTVLGRVIGEWRPFEPGPIRTTEDWREIGARAKEAGLRAAGATRPFGSPKPAPKVVK